MSISWEDFEKIDIRTGTIIEVNDFPNARKPAYRLNIDFGLLGLKNCSAQITTLYEKKELLQKQVIVVVNFPIKQIGNFFSECLLLGVYSPENEVILLQPERTVENGMKIG